MGMGLEMLEDMMHEGACYSEVGGYGGLYLLPTGRYVWECEDGRRISLAKLDTDHLANIIALIPEPPSELLAELKSRDTTAQALNKLSNLLK